MDISERYHYIGKVLFPFRISVDDWMVSCVHCNKKGGDDGNGEEIRRKKCFLNLDRKSVV